MDLAVKVRNIRRLSMITQAQLSQISGVSIPTIQNIEANRANPSVKVLSELLSSLGHQLSIQPTEPDWEYLIECGLPLSSVRFSRQMPELFRFREELQKACIFMIVNPLPRELLALESLTWALSHSYPHTFKKHFELALFRQFIPSNPSGQHIKLKRICEDRISRFL